MPNTLNFQARLLNSSGSLVADGNYSVEFKLYDAQSGGTLAWTETQTVSMKAGYMSVYLGSVNQTLDTLDWSQQYWLTLNVASDGEMTPRIRLTSVPYAFRSGQADSLTNGSGTLTADDFAQLGSPTPQVVNLALTALRINQTGAGGLMQLQGNGADVFTVSKTGDVASVGSGTFSGGTLTVGSPTQAGGVMLHEGNGNTFTLQTGSQSGNLTFTLPTGYGTNGDCLKGNGAGVLSFNACAGANSFVNGGNGFGSIATLGTTDSNSLQLITGGSQAMLIDTSGNVRIGNSGSPSEKLDVNGAIRIGSTASANAGTIRWTGSDFEGYNGSQWISFTTGAGNANATASFVSGRANVAANVTGLAVEKLVFTTATAVSNIAGDGGTIAPASGSFRTCQIKNTAAITGGTLNLRWRVNNVSVGAGACTMDSTNNRDNSDVLNANVVTFNAGDTIGIAFDTVGLAPTNNDFTVYWSVEYNSSGATSSATLQDVYNNSTSPATITTASGKDLKVVLTDTATDASLLVDIATGSTGRFAVQDNGTDVLAVTSTGITLSKQVTVTMGLDLANSGIANAGSITGIGANLTGAGALTIASASSGDLTFNSASGLVVLGASTLRAADSFILDMQKATDTVLTLQNSGAGISNLNLADGGLQTAGTLRLTNGGVLQNITGLTVTSGGASISGNITLGGSGSDRITFTGQVFGASPLVFQGATDDSFTTTLAVANPTSNNTITLPNASGTIVLDIRTISAGTGLSGGGDLSANRTLNLDINGLTSTNAVNQSDYVAIYDGTGIKKISRSNFLQGVIGALQYQGTWDAATNTPTLADNTGTNGQMYAVSVAATRDLGSGNITFLEGDFVIHNGTRWELAPSATGVNSVYGRSGDVTAQNGDYTASQITNVAAGNIAATTLQAAINELDSEKLGSLNGLTTASQTFANDTNITITSSGSTHSFGWSGQLSVTRGGTGAGSFTTNGVLYGNNTGTLQVTAAGTGGQLLVANSSGVPTFTTLSGDATLSDTGVLNIGADKVALSTDTTGSYVANLGTLTGLSTTGNSGEGSIPTLSVIYGNGANTAVQGNTTLICPSGTGNLSGGGNTITLGSGGMCNSLDTQAAVTFGNSVNTPILTSAGGLIISSAASGDITLNSGTNKLVIDGSDVMLQRTGSGAFAIDLNDGSTTSLLLENTGAGVANLNLSDGGLQIAGTTVLTNGLVLQNVTADTSILTSGLLPVARGGTGADTFTANGIIYGNGTGVLQVTGTGLTNQCLIATTGGAPSWGSCTGGAGVATLQQTYDSGSTITTTDNRSIAFTLDDTATDSNFLINIATGSTSKFAIQANSTDVLRVTSTGTVINTGGLTILTGGASIIGGIDNNSGGITEAGSITGVGSNITGSGDLTFASGGSGNLTFDSASGLLIIAANDTGMQRTAVGTYTVDLNDGGSTALIINNTGAGTASLNIQDGSLQMAGTTVLTNGRALQSLTGISTTGGLVFNSFSGSAGLMKVDSAGNVSISTAGTDYEMPLTFGNGLTRTGNAVVLGGALTGGTDIALSGNNLLFSGTGNVGIGSATPNYKFEVDGDIRSSGNLIEKSVSFTPTAVGWYRIATGVNMMGGTIRVTAPLYDNTLTDVELQYNVSGYALIGSIQQTRFSSFNNGVVSAVRTSTDGLATLYLDIFISQATAPQPITIYGYGPNQPDFVAAPVVGATVGSSSVNFLTLGQGFRSTQGAVFAETGGTVGIGTSGTPSALLSIGGTTGHLTVDASGNLATGGTTRLSFAGALQNITGLTIISGGANITGGIDNNSGGITEAGALSGITTIAVSGAITGAIATDTINGLIINAGALSGVTGLTFSSGSLNLASGGITNAGSIAGVTTLNLTGAITGATATNTINGLIINAGALSGISTINTSGAITGATSTNTINGLVINAGALSSVTGITLTSGSLNLANGGITNTGSIAGATTLALSGAISGATTTDTINGLIINAGALSGITTIVTSGNITTGGTFVGNGQVGDTLAACTAGQYIGNGVKIDDGLVTAGTCRNDATGISDERVKKNITSVGSVLDKMKELNIVSFDFKRDELPELNLDRGLQYGVIAQELEKIFPELVAEREDGYKEVNFQGLSFYTLKAVTELAAQVNTMSNGSAGGVSTGGTLRLTNEGKLQNITGLALVSGGASIAGGINNNGGGINNIGAVLGATNINGQSLLLNANNTDNLLTFIKDNKGVFTVFNNGALGLKLDAANAFGVKNANGLAIFTIDTQNGKVVMGSGDNAKTVLFILDSRSTVDDPAGTNGASYYNAAAGRFRCYQDNRWQDCLPAGDLTTSISSNKVIWKQPSADTELQDTPRITTSLNRAHEFRLNIRVIEPGAANATCRLQYANNDSGPWSDLMAGGSNELAINKTGTLKTDWVKIAEAARGGSDTIIRVMCKGGEVSITPVIYGVSLQIR